MPIEVRHGPDLRLVGGAAHRAGLGQYAERQEDRALRQRQIDQQAAFAQARLQAQRASDRDRYNLAAEQQRQAEVGRIDALNAQRRSESDSLTQYINNREAPAAASPADDKWGQASAEYLEGQVALAQELVENNELAPAGEATYADLQQKLRAVQKKRGVLRPGQYSQLVGQWLEEFDKSGLTRHIKPKPTTQQVLAERSVQLPDGSMALFQSDGKGGGKFERWELGQEGTTPQASLAQHFSDPKVYEKEYKAAAQSILDSHPDRMKAPDPKEVHKEMIRRKKAHDEFLSSLAEGESTDNVSQKAPQPEAEAQQLAETLMSKLGLWNKGEGEPMKSDTLSQDRAPAPTEPIAPEARQFVDSINNMWSAAGEDPPTPEQAQEVIRKNAEHIGGSIRGLMGKYKSFADMPAADRQRLIELKAAYDAIKSKTPGATNG